MRNNLWLTGIGTFTALLFGFLAFFNYLMYDYRRETYYLVGMVVFGAIALFSIVAVINSWRRKLPGPAFTDEHEQASETAADEQAR